MPVDAFVTTTPAGSTGAVEYCGGSVFVGAGWKFYGSTGNERLVSPSATDDGGSRLIINGNTLTKGNVLVDISASTTGTPTLMGASGVTGGLKFTCGDQNQGFWGGSSARLALFCWHGIDIFGALGNPYSGPPIAGGGQTDYGMRIVSSATANKPLGIQAVANQTANLVEFLNSTPSVVASVNPSGAGNFSGLQSTITDGATSTISNVNILEHDSTGTPTAGFGASTLYRLQSSTTASRSAAEIDVSWATATDASRKARMTLGVYDFTTLRNGLQIDTNGNAAQVTSLSSFVEQPMTLPFSSTVNTDASSGNLFGFTATSNFTLSNPTNGTDGQKVVWRIKQGGGTSAAITFGTNFGFGVDIGSGVVLSNTSGSMDYLGAIYNSSASKWHVVSLVRGY